MGHLGHLGCSVQVVWWGWYSDWWNGGDGGGPAWETFHVTELRDILERDWRAGDQRMVAGTSMGGYGAMHYATAHPELFRAAASFNGVLDPVGATSDWLEGWLAPQNEAFVARREELGIPVTVEMGQGMHTLPYRDRSLRLALPLLLAALEA